MSKANDYLAMPIYVIVAWLCLAATLDARAQHQRSDIKSGESTNTAPPLEAELAIKRFKALPGLKVDLWAAEPLVVNPVAFAFDEKGRAYVCETFRLGAGVDDIRGIMDWLDEELAGRTVADREAEMKRHLGSRFPKYSEKSERIRLLEDTHGLGHADHATVFAEHFNTPLDGIGAGVLARKGRVWYADIPNLWLLQDTNADGVADVRTSLHYGFGVRVGFLGHDLHGLHFGPDGRLYFSIGDRGSHIKLADGRTVGDLDSGCVFRCNPDGSDLEVFASGLRNPQDLVFDQYGNLFTGDNNSDSGDQARWVYLVEGSDNGWRVGFQFMQEPYSRGPFNAERLWYPAFPGQAANIVPPIANIASGPSGVAYFPGTGLPAAFQDHFFLVDFRGGAVNSGVHTFTLTPKGAGFSLTDPEHFVWGILATDTKFGVDGGLYVTDWVEGWGMPGKGRIYRVHSAESDNDAVVAQTKRLLADGFDQRSSAELAKLLAHPDMRIRQEAQFALAERGADSIGVFVSVARDKASQVARFHAIWGLGQLTRGHAIPASQGTAGWETLSELFEDPDPEVRAQVAKVLGEAREAKAFAAFIKGLQDPSPRVRFFAAFGLGKLGRREALPAIYGLLRENADGDPYLRHAGVMALAGIGDVDALMGAAHDDAPAVRLGVLLALRRLQRPEIAVFLRDSSPMLALEAARAINDEPINAAMPELAHLISSPWLDRFLAGEPFLPASVVEGKPKRVASRLGLEALLRRVLNANFHFGTAESARALAEFAARSEPSAEMRVEALEELGDWAHPPGRDRVMGLWRPEAAVRPSQAASQALEPKLVGILRSAPDSVQVSLLKAVERLVITNAAPLLTEVLTNTGLADIVRAAALSALADLDSPLLEAAMEHARKDSSELVRNRATRLEGKLASSDPVIRLARILDRGSVSEQQTAFAALAGIPGSAADTLLMQWLERLEKDRVPNEVRLDLLEAARKRSSAPVHARLEQYEASRPQTDPLAPYQECLFGGAAAEGRKIFFEKEEVQCVRCHKVDAQGGDVGPDLTHVGAQKDRRYLLESIVLPNKQIAPGFDSVTVTLKDGDSYAGVLKSETASDLVLNTPDQGLVTIKKADIDARRAALSPMPEGLGQILSKEELRSLVEFLSSLK